MRSDKRDGNRVDGAARGLLLALLLLLSGCAAETGVVVDIGVWPQGAEVIRVRSTLNQVRGPDLFIQAKQSRFVVLLPGSSLGTLSLDLTALDAGGCKVAAGQLQEAVGPYLPVIDEVAVAMAVVSPTVCTLTVNVAKGEVTTDRPEIVCPASSSPCEFDLTPGTRISLTAHPNETDEVPLWTQGCTGYSQTCSITVDKGRTVTLQWEPRLCTPGGWCWWNPLQGLVANTVSVSRSGEVWILGTGSSILKCKGDFCGLILGLVQQSSFYIVGPSIAASSGGDVLWVANHGVPMQRCSGTTCSEISAGTTWPLRSIGVSDSGDAWAVGDQGTVVKCTAAGCTLIDSGLLANLVSVGVSKSGTAWAVSADGNVLKCEGAACANIYRMAQPPAIDLPLTLSVSSAGEAWAGVGMFPSSRLLRCSGDSCTSINLPPSAVITGVGAGRSGEAWVTLRDGRILLCNTVECNEAAAGFVFAPYGVPSYLLPRLRASEVRSEVWIGGPAGPSVWCEYGGGQGCKVLDSASGGIVSLGMGENGEAWAVTASSAVLRCDSQSCASTSAKGISGFSDISSCGNGQAWTIDDLSLCRLGSCSPIPHETLTHLSRVSCTDGQAVVAGSYGIFLRCRDSGCTRFVSGTVADLNDLTTNQKGDAWAITSGGEVLRCFKDTNCTVLYSGSQVFSSVSVSGTDAVWAVGRDGVVLYCGSGGCTAATSGTTVNLQAVSTDYSSEGWAAGDYGTVLRCRGGSCSAIPSGTSAQLRSIAVSTRISDEVWAAGDKGTVLHCGSTTCNQVPSGTTEPLNSVKIASTGEVWVVGGNTTGICLRCANDACSEVPCDTGSALNRVSVSSGGEVWAAGNNGVVLQRAP